MAVSTEQKAAIVVEHGANAKDCGKAEVQIALLTARIVDLGNHFSKNPKDHHGRRGLMRMVGRRRRLLDYLQRHELDRYRAIIAKLDLRK